MYKYKNYEYTLEEIQDAADKENLSVEEYIKEYNIDPPATETEVTEEVITDPIKEGKKKPTTEEDATVVEEIVAPDTASALGDTSLELQEIDNSPEAIKARRKFNRQEEIAIMQDPIGLKSVEVTAKKPKPFSFWKDLVLTSEYDKAFEQLSKDTGKFSSTEAGGIQNVIDYFSQIPKLFTPVASREEESTYDPINIDLLTRIEVAKILTPRDFDKLKKGGFNLKEKEQLLNKAKTKIVRKTLYSFEKDIENDFLQLNNEQKIIQDRLVSTFGEIEPSSRDFVTQASADLYNNLNDRLNNIQEKKKNIANEYTQVTENLKSNYGFELATGVFENNFKLTNEVENFNTKVKENGLAKLNAKLVGGIWKAASDIVVFPGVLMALAGDSFNDAVGVSDEDTYSEYDMFKDIISNVANYNTLGDTGKARIVDDKGNLISFSKNAGEYLDTTLDMLPFTLGIMASAMRGNVNNVQKKMAQAFSGKGVYNGMSNSLKQEISMFNAAYAMTFNDNLLEGKDLGLTDKQAMVYANNMSLGTSLSQAIMPDINFLKGITGKKLVQGFTGNLKTAANKKALGEASKQFFGNIMKEVGEEEAEFILDKANKMAFGLSLGDWTDFVGEQKQLLAGTFMLSGGLGSVGAIRTNSIVKKEFYNGIVNQQQTLLNNLQTQQSIAKSEGNFKAVEQLEKAQIFVTDIIRASKVSPQNVTANQLDLVVKKQKLINEKKNLDSSFHGPIDEQIATIDAQIAESKVTTTKTEVGEKLKKGVDALGKKLGFKIKGLKDNKAVKEYLDKIAPGKNNIKKAGNFGFFVINPDGTKEIIINEEANKKAGVITTETHEAFHFVLSETLKNNPDTQKAFGNALLNELKKIDQGQIANSEYIQRLNQYLRDPKISEGDSLEEALTLFSEATLNGDIVYNEDIITKIGDFIRQTLQSVGFEQVVFNEGKDVFNFIKDYNNSIKKGRADKFITDVATKGAVGKLTKKQTTQEAETVIKESRSEEAKTESIKQTLDKIDQINLDTKDNENKFKSKEEFRNSPQFGEVLQEMLAEDGLFDGLIIDKSGIDFTARNPQETTDFIENVKGDLIKRFSGKNNLGNFDPTKNSLFGYFTGNNGLIANAIKNVKKDFVERDIKTSSLDVEAGETGSIREIGTADEVDMDAFMAQTDAINESNITNLKLIKEEIKTSDGKKITKLKENIEREVKEKGPKLTEKELTYKTSPDYGTPTILKAINDSFQNSTEFKKLYDAKSKQLDREIADGKTNREGQKISKANELQKFKTGYILRPEDFAGSGNLSQKKFPIVKDFIDQNIKLIIENLPKAAVTRKDPVSKKIENTSTGVPNNFLNNPNLYAKTEERIGNSGIFVYEKRKGITSKDIFEMLEGKPLVKGKFGLPMQNAKQFINNLGQFATNQELRLQDFITPQQSADLEGGKDSKILFSKSMELPILNSLRVGGNQNELLSIKFSKSSKDAYEKILIGRRPELRDASEQVDNLFKWVDTLDIPENKKSKHEKLALFYMGNGNLILPEDGYKVEDAIKVAAKNKLDPFSYKNPNELLEKFAGDISPKKINPDNLSTFSNKQELTDGITTYEIENSRAGQADVRKIIDSNWGEKANPWCLAALIDGNLDQAWDYWKRYSGKKQIAFQNNKLLAFNAFDQYNPLADPRWYDRMDKATEGLVFYKKINDPRGLKLKLELNTKNNSTKQIGYEVGSPKSNFYQEYNIDKELIAEIKRTATKEVFFNDTLKSNAVEEWKDGDEGAKFELVFYTPIENGILEEDPIDFEDADSDLQFWDRRTAIDFVEPDSKKDRYGNRKSTNSKYIYESVNPKQKYIVQAKAGGDFGYIVEYKELNGVKFLTGRDIINNYVMPDKKAPPEQLEFAKNLESVSKLIGTTYGQLLGEIHDTAFLLDSNNKPIIPIKFPFLNTSNKGEFEIDPINEISNEIDNESANPPLNIKYSKSFDFNFKESNGGILYQKQKALFIEEGEIFQEKFGSIEKQRGSVRGSHIITAKALFKGYDTMSDDEQAIAKKETIEIRDRAIEYKVQSGAKSLLEPGDSSYGSPQSKFGRTPEELKKSIADGVVAKENKQNVRIWNEMWKNRIYDLLESNPEMIDYIETFLELSNNDLSHPQRGGAALTAFDPNAKGEKVEIKIEGLSYNPKTDKLEEGVIKEVIKTLEYEHAKPSNIVRKELLKEAKRLIKLGKNKTSEEKAELKKQFSEFVDNTRKNYALWAVAYNDARKLDKANLAHKMPKGETILWKRYFNKLVAKYGGINPKKLFTIIGNEVGPSVADTFGIKNNKGELTEFGKNQLKLSKSISKAAKNNNSKLPKSEQFPKSWWTSDAVTSGPSQMVIDRLKKIDDQANEARIKYSKSQDLDDTFNKIIENKTGIETYQRFDRAGATVKGASKGKFNFFIPSSAEDFVGLLYKTLGKGKVGDSQMQFYKDNLLDPYGRAMNDVSSARVAMFEDYKALKEDLNIIPKDLSKKGVEEYTREQAVRVYIWDQQENKIPGIFKTNQQKLVDYVNANPDLKQFGDQLIAMQKGDGYVTPKEGWLAGTITTDLLDSVNSIKRKKYLEQWQTNVDEMFGESNMNKLEAAFGKSYRRALEDALSRMKSGRNKKFTAGNEQVNAWTNWVNNSVGTIMFLNSRSAILQTLSTVNFLNFEDNNVFKAGAAFANQPQYWKDFKFLFNSDFLKERRGGLRFNVSESEIADAAKRGGARGVVSKILQAGFLPTQMADSFAIAAGGATFYRNRLNTYLKETDADGNKIYTEAEAQEKTFLDFRETAEESQQSSRPDRISMEQAGPLGRTILAFANTPAQYTRIMKKAVLDIKNGRGSLKANVSRLIYYGVVQNVIFGAIQAATFSLAFGDGDEEDQLFEEKAMRIANGTADSILRGAGLYGAIAATIKNTAIKLIKESKKPRTDYFEAGLVELAGISPPIQSKVKKWRSATKSYEYNKKEMAAKGFSLDSPSYLAGANVIAAFTNLPTDRVVKKVTNVYDAIQEDVEVWKRTALLMGWSKWELEPTVKKTKTIQSSRRGSSRSTSRSSSRSSNKR